MKESIGCALEFLARIMFVMMTVLSVVLTAILIFIMLNNVYVWFPELVTHPTWFGK